MSPRTAISAILGCALGLYFLGGFAVQAAGGYLSGSLLAIAVAVSALATALITGLIYVAMGLAVKFGYIGKPLQLGAAAKIIVVVFWSATLVGGILMGKKANDESAAAEQAREAEIRRVAALTPEQRAAELKQRAEVDKQVEKLKAEKAEKQSAKYLGETLIRSMLKDPGSAVFKEGEGRISHGMHVACGYVNAKNSFGAMTGFSPWLVVIETKTAVVEGYDDRGSFAPLWNKYCAGPDDTEQPQRPAPNMFRGFRLNSALPSKDRLLKGVLSQCPKIVEEDVLSAKRSSCYHSHSDVDDMDMFVQKVGVPALFGAHASEQMFSWSHKKLWRVDVYIHNFSDDELQKIASSLAQQFGPPTETGKNLSRWTWAEKKVEVQLSWDPEVKPSLDPSEPASNSITVSMAQTE